MSDDKKTYKLLMKQRKNKKMLAFLNSPDGKAWGGWWDKFAPTFGEWFWHKKNPTMGEILESYIACYRNALEHARKPTKTKEGITICSVCGTGLGVD